jgi:squalene synthase HpnC
MIVSSPSARLQGGPPAFTEPVTAPTLQDARAWCKSLAESHYENFHVATWFLPAQLRLHFYSIYAYCRVSDDLSDEVADPLLALRLLNEWEQMLQEVYDSPASVKHPVLVALAETIRACDIPREPFLHLLVSFRSDQSFSRYRTLEDLDMYSDSSANPVGHLVLYASGYRDPELFALSDKICTGLQYANMWQDVGPDLEVRDRIYLPQDEMDRFGVTVQQLQEGEFTPAYRELLRYLVGKTRVLFAEGQPIEDRVDADLASTLRLFRRGGEAILDAIEAIDFNTIHRRPIVTKGAKVRLLAGAFTGKIAAAFRPKKRRAA